MSFSLIVRPEAESEMAMAFDWYENRRKGLGEKFISNVQVVFDQISANPLVHGLFYSDIRCAIVPRFPYGVYYFVDGSSVVVIAVYHSSRDPSIWQARK
jgi:toxin ParE1/3/4